MTACAFGLRITASFFAVLGISGYQAPAWELGERLFSPEPNPTAPRSEDPSGLLRIPQVLRRM